jgi:hypothetical protein
MSAFSHCIHCGRRLRDAIFCPECGMSTCSWACQAQHAASHEREAAAAQPAWDSLGGLMAEREESVRTLSRSRAAS